MRFFYRTMSSQKSKQALKANATQRNALTKLVAKKAKRKCTNAKGHLKTLHSSEGPSTPKGASACPSGNWLRSLSSGPGGQGLVSWVFPFGVAASIDRYHFVPTNAGLADGADLTLGPGFQPGSQAGPTEEVSTHRYNGVCGHINKCCTQKLLPVPPSSCPLLRRCHPKDSFY